MLYLDGENTNYLKNQTANFLIFQRGTKYYTHQYETLHDTTHPNCCCSRENDKKGGGEGRCWAQNMHTVFLLFSQSQKLLECEMGVHLVGKTIFNLNTIYCSHLSTFWQFLACICFVKNEKKVTSFVLFSLNSWIVLSGFQLACFG